MDIRGGRCVRLFQGDYARETTFSDDPLAMALRWQSQGAHRIHVVDLDGAASGEPQNLDVISQIATAVMVPVQLGGGIRDIETIKKVLSAGVERVILGTAAVENEEMLKEACQKYGDYVAVSIDARDGMVATWGWQEDSGIRAEELAKRMQAIGVERLIYTDITADGTLTSPNFGAIAEFIKATPLPVISAGGVASVDNIRELNRLGVAGAIIGKALYTGDVDLRAALRAIEILD